MNSNPKILVVGAAGRYAGLLVPELINRGAVVRGLVRNAGQGTTARENGAAEIAIGDLRDRASLDAAMRGMDGVYYIAPVYPGDESQRVGQSFVEAAKAADVRRIVFSSVIHPVISQLVNHIQKSPVEAAVIESGLEFTILNPSHFFQNMAAMWPQVIESGIFIEPFSAEKRLSHVDYRDVAEVAAIALTEDHLRNGTFQLCADYGHDRNEVAAIMSDVIGRPIKAEAMDTNTWLAKSNRLQDDFTKQSLKIMFDYYDTYGLLGNPLTLRAILGREPRSLRQFFVDLLSGVRTTAR